MPLQYTFMCTLKCVFTFTWRLWTPDFLVNLIPTVLFKEMLCNTCVMVGASTYDLDSQTYKAVTVKYTNKEKHFKEISFPDTLLSSCITKVPWGSSVSLSDQLFLLSKPRWMWKKKKKKPAQSQNDGECITKNSPNQAQKPLSDFIFWYGNVLKTRLIWCGFY